MTTKLITRIALGAALALGLLTGAATISLSAPPTDCLGFQITDDRPTENADFLSGTDVRDVAALGDGGDQYFAGTGSDILCGNEANDVLGGEGGPDQLSGGGGDDIVAGHGGGDELWAGDGADRLDGGGGPDTLRAGSNDGSADELYDGPGTDTLIGSSEDTWYRCGDDTTDVHDQFFGQILPDPSC